jgi:hypothetical protein
MKAFEQACRDEAEAALAVLKAIMNDKDASDSARLSAAREILDRGQGKAVDRSVLLNLNADSDGRSGEAIITDDELRRIAAGGGEGLGGSGRKIIDIRPVDDD